VKPGLPAIRVTYTFERDTNTFTFTLGIQLCNEAKAWAKECEALRSRLDPSCT
jgi:hypothetical protein